MERQLLAQCTYQFVAHDIQYMNKPLLIGASLSKPHPIQVYECSVMLLAQACPCKNHHLSNISLIFLTSGISLFLDIGCDVCTQVLEGLEVLLPKEVSTFVSVCLYLLIIPVCGSDQFFTYIRARRTRDFP